MEKENTIEQEKKETTVMSKLLLNMQVDFSMMRRFSHEPLVVIENELNKMVEPGECMCKTIKDNIDFHRINIQHTNPASDVQLVISEQSQFVNRDTDEAIPDAGKAEYVRSQIACDVVYKKRLICNMESDRVKMSKAILKAKRNVIKLEDQYRSYTAVIRSIFFVICSIAALAPEVNIDASFTVTQRDIERDQTKILNMNDTKKGSFAVRARCGQVQIFDKKDNSYIEADVSLYNVTLNIMDDLFNAAFRRF